MKALRRQWYVKKAIFDAARDVRDRTGKSVLTQFLEMLRLRFGQGRLRAADYFVYGVYDDARYPPARKREVLSWSPTTIADRMNDPSWRAICDDKLACYGTLKGLNVPFPQVYGLYDPRGRTFGSVPSLVSPLTAATFLRDGVPYPFFAKTISGGYGRGASSVESIDTDRDELTFKTGEKVAVEDYVRQYVAPARDGYLFQAPARQHPLIERVSGGRVGTLRIIILLGDDAPRLFRAIWRIPVGRNITDNFLHGVQGNLVANVDRDTGVVGSAVQAVTFTVGAEGEGHGVGATRDTHPDTGEPIAGITVPHWDRIRETCLHGAAALPGLRYQSWDVVVGPDGPLVLELNYKGGIDITQIPGTPGFFDDEFRAFWKRYSR